MALNLRFRVINTIFPEKELLVTLYRSPKVHPDRFENLKDLQLLKQTDLDSNGFGELDLTQKEIDELRKSRRNIYLTLSVDHDKQPVFITGTFLLAKLQKQGLFAIDLKNDRILSDYEYKPGEIESDAQNDRLDHGETSKPEESSDAPEELDIESYSHQSIGEQAREDQALIDQEREELQHGLKEALVSRRERRKRRKSFVRDLIKQRPGKKPRHDHVPANEDVSSKQDEKIKEMIERLRDSSQGMSLLLDEELLEELGLKPGDDWKSLSKEQWQKLYEILRKEPPQRRKNPTLQDCRNQSRIKQISGDQDNDENEEESTSTETNLNSSLNDLFDQLVGELHATFDTSKRPGRDEIAESVQESIASGPADTTAYYDFHTLSIAWKDIWTNVYDKHTEKEVADLYDEIVEVVGDDVAAEIENSEFEELNDFLDSLSETVKDAKRSPGHRVPGDMKSWLPQLEDVWHELSYDDKRYLRFLRSISTDDAGFVFERPSRPRPSSSRPRPSGGLFGRRWSSAIKLGPIRINPGKWGVFGRFRKKTKRNRAMQSHVRPAGGKFPGRRRFEQWMYDSVPDNVDVSVWARTTALNLIEADQEQSPGIGRLGRMLEGIHQRLYREPYEFDVFAKNSYNFGLVQTYQQKWKPLNYQAGKLVSTIPLAPGEKKTYSVKRNVVTSTSTTDKRSTSLNQTSDTSTMSRSQADIVAKTAFAASTSATVNTNFSGSVELFKFGGTTSNTATGNVSSDSQKTKQDIRESTLKAAQEYKDENSVEVVTSTDVTEEITTTSEISNPNNEITVTYLFYELQRQYEVSSRLDKLTPVVMVAFDVPQPSEIDEDWLLTYDWILRKALLDPSLAIALDYLRSGLTGDELSVEVYKAQWETQKRIVEEIKDNLKVHLEMRDVARKALKESSEMVADKFDAKDAATVATASILNPFGLVGMLASAASGKSSVSDAITADVSKDEIAAAQESARLGLEWARADLQAAQSKEQAAVYALEKATQNYVDAITRRQQMRTRIDQLRIHVKENILHYMQAIWAHEHKDQRYFRLYDQEIIWPKSDKLPVIKNKALSKLENLTRVPMNYREVRRHTNLEIKVAPPSTASLSNLRPLYEVADLDKLLGFKGNYAIFPLREHNALTDYLSQGFIDNYFGINDLDPDGNLPTESEALEMAECMWKQANEIEDEEKKKEKRSEIVNWLTEVLDRQIYISDEIVVPTGEVFIEALPGSHPLLEDFKLRHRAIDMKKAQEGLTHSRIEALRRLKRLMQDDLSDPEVDKNIQISGQSTNVNVDTE